MSSGTSGKSTEAERGYRPIADYAIIGDCSTVALVASDGSIDWCCAPHFDSPAVFCRLLDAGQGGFFQIQPADDYKSSRAYVGPTNVLATTFDTGRGRIRLTDFMPMPEKSGNGKSAAPAQRTIARLIEGLAGDVDVDVSFRPTFDYARATTTVTPLPRGGIARGGGQSAVLRAPMDFSPDERGGLRGRTRVSAGDRLWVSLQLVPTSEPESIAEPPPDLDRALKKTLDFWHRWSRICTYVGPYQDLVQRSALALKLLAFDATGAMVAAPTTSLPEQLRGPRNWDYRFSWLRDSSLILQALHAIGYHDEEHRFFDWLQGVWLRYDGSLQPVYTVEGESQLAEKELAHLEGYGQSSPVRIGNAAANQFQLDMFGEVLDAAHFRHGELRPPNPQPWEVLRGLADQAATHWREPDRGIWEVRGEPRQFLYSQLLCWVALDRAIKLAQTHHLPADLERWRQCHAEIRRGILTKGYNSELGAFTQALDEPVLDASALAIPIVGFLPATDQRVQSTIDKIRERLTSNGLVYRYLTDDGISGDEGTFALCSFWLVDNLALAGRIDAAHTLFEHVTGYANDLGLLSEEIDPVKQELRGNFPQGFSHLTLIRSALHIARGEVFGPEHQAKTPAERAPDLAHAGQQPNR